MMDRVRAGVSHCDVKAENVCVVSAKHAMFKLIDFGSAVFKFDCHNSYVQSRWCVTTATPPPPTRPPTPRDNTSPTSSLQHFVHAYSSRGPTRVEVRITR